MYFRDTFYQTFLPELSQHEHNGEQRFIREVVALGRNEREQRPCHVVLDQPLRDDRPLLRQLAQYGHQRLYHALV